MAKDSSITAAPTTQKSVIWWVVVLVFLILVIPVVILATKITKVLLQLLGYGGSGGGIGGSGISFFDVVLGVIGWKWLQSKFPNNVPFDGTSPVNVSNTSEAQAAAETGAEGSAAESTSVESAIEQLMEGE